MTKVVDNALTFDDVLLLPRYSEVLPKDASLKTRLSTNIELNIPLLSAAMDTVTTAKLAIALAEEGGVGVLHKNMSIDAQAGEVRKVKKFESGVVNDPITVTPETSIAELKKITAVHNISGMPVVDGRQLVGIITSRDIRFATDFNQPVANLMTPKARLITVPEHAEREQVIDLFHQHRIEKLLIVNDAFELRGMYTVKDILKAEQRPNACKTTSGQLRVAAAVGIGQGTHDRVAALVKEGVDLLVVDTAHGHSKNVLDMVRWIKKNYAGIDIMAGNIATSDAAKDLIAAGVNAVKVGMGPGSICTTRIVAGVGVPQISAIFNVAEVAKKSKVGVVADGGIRFSGDICKAIAAGADAIMIGGLFAGTEEAPGEIVLYQGRSYKSYRGMGSVGAMSQQHGSSDRYFQDVQAEVGKFVPEGIEGRVPYKGRLQAVIHQLMGGLRSSMGYAGCSTIGEMHQHAKLVQITPASMRESHVHDVIITKEAPNYWVDK
ncbi:MAG: IMP dehydrogenase [Gammaproteobacteria bacterium]|nr:IMP dehydrogenase [Gammaproteobacteria bacterium]